VMGLSFSEEFFSGDGSVDLYDIQPSARPTSVLQAIISLPAKTQRAIAQHVLGISKSNLRFYVGSESFASDVMEKARETDLCDGCTPPVRVYLDPSQHYWVDVYEDGRCEQCNETLVTDGHGVTYCMHCGD
jgi:hypothetical protein